MSDESKNNGNPEGNSPQKNPPKEQLAPVVNTHSADASKAKDGSLHFARNESGMPEVEMAMQRGYIPPTNDMALWVAIRKSTDNIGFNNYMEFIDNVISGTLPQTQESLEPAVKATRIDTLNRSMPFAGVDGYRLLKTATEVFLIAYGGIHMATNLEAHSGIAYTEGDAYIEDYPLNDIDSKAESRRLERQITSGQIQEMWKEYLRRVNGTADLKTLPYLDIIRDKLSDQTIIPRSSKDGPGSAEKYWGILREKLRKPFFVELIWNYWMEEGMLVQTTNAITMRFQNRRGPGDRDPLANLEVDPLRPLNGYLWGYLQDEQHRLSLARRVYEYDHQYGIALHGKAVPEVRGADSRSKFMEAFHNLLNLCNKFYQQDDNAMIIADGFPVLNALKEVHLLLTQGQHNQYGDLPWNARQEMLMQQWLLARPEMREFLTSRIMVAYPEPWMERVDTMKKLQGWTDTPITHFRDLAVFGEKILLSVRFNAWIEIFEPAQAANWARYWRPEIQSYMHAYRAATGADLTSEPVDSAMPMVHLRRRLEQQRLNAA